MMIRPHGAMKSGDDPSGENFRTAAGRRVICEK